MISLGLDQPPVEVRSTSYTDQIITAAESAASIGTVRSSSLSVLESCAGLIARSLGAAYVRPGTAAVTPAFLHQVGGDLVRRGESVHVLSISDRGTVAWWPGADWDVTGEPDPETWLYRVRLAGPSTTVSRTVPRAAVVGRLTRCSHGKAWARSSWPPARRAWRLLSSGPYGRTEDPAPPGRDAPFTSGNSATA